MKRNIEMVWSASNPSPMCHHINNKSRMNLFAQLQVFLNFNVAVSVGLLLGKMALKTDNGRLRQVRQQSANTLLVYYLATN